MMRDGGLCRIEHDERLVSSGIESQKDRAARVWRTESESDKTAPLGLSPKRRDVPRGRPLKLSELDALVADRTAGREGVGKRATSRAGRGTGRSQVACG